MTDMKAVATALLGSWPNQVAAWGKEGIAAYLAELGARGVTPEAALVAIRSCDASQKFPPSAPELAALARQDPSAPTFEEALTLALKALKATEPYSGPVLDPEASRDRAAKAQLASMHPLVGELVVRCGGLSRLRMLELDGEDGYWRRKELREAWDAMCEALEGREVAALASGRRGEIARLDPLRALGVPVTRQLAGAKVEGADRG